jgi:hypothetical protein
MDGSARQPKEESPSQAGTLALIFCDALGGGVRPLAHLSAAPGSHSPRWRACPGWPSARSTWLPWTCERKVSRGLCFYEFFRYGKRLGKKLCFFEKQEGAQRSKQAVSSLRRARQPHARAHEGGMFYSTDLLSPKGALGQIWVRRAPRFDSWVAAAPPPTRLRFLPHSLLSPLHCLSVF